MPGEYPHVLERKCYNAEVILQIILVTKLPMSIRNGALAALAIGSLVIPSITMAQQNVQGLFLLASNLLNALIGMLITLAIVVFFWGLIKYLLSGGATDEAHKGIHQMIWGIVAIFVMVSIWGLVALLQRTFGVENNKSKVPDAIQMRWVQ